MTNPSTYQDLNTQGFIPGPQETEEEFLQRVHFCQHLQQELSSQVGADLPFKTADQASKEILQEATYLTQKLYGIAPTWVPLFFSNHQLAPWHAGCAWIFQLTKQTPTAAFLQLRARFLHQPRYLGLYQRHELIAHELAHVGRMMFEEPQFEEVLAYQSSTGWRRWLGPIVQSSKETLFFILILGVLVMTYLAAAVISHPMTVPISLSLNLFLISLMGLALGRVAWRHWQFRKTLNHLTALYQDLETAHHLLYRLRDLEIQQFSSLSPIQIKNWIQSAQKNSFRWQFILKNYPLP